MTSSYTPQGRRVGLDGPSAVGFQPVQTYDTSERVLAARTEQIRNQGIVNEQGLEALATFSKTALDFLVDRQKGINENTRLEYLTKALNGDIAPTPEAVESYQEGVTKLKTAAYGERAALNELEEVDKEAAVEIRERDPVLTGWAAYGDAQGRALRAKMNAPMLALMMSSQEKTISVPTEDGGSELISPAEARERGPAAFNAAWEVTLRAWTREMGIERVNPILLVESVTPAVIEMRTRLLADSLEATAKRQQAEVRDQYLNILGAEINSLDSSNPEAVSAFIQKATLEGKTALGLKNQGEANKEVVTLIGQLAVTRGDPVLLDNIKAAVVNPKDPNGVTFGDHPVYGPILADFTEKVEARRQARAQDMEKLNKDEVGQVLTGFEIDVAQANDPSDFEAIRSKAIAILQGMGTPAAQEGIAQLLGQEFKGRENFLLSIENRLKQGDKSITKRMIEKQVTLGNLPSNAMGLLGRFFPTDAVDGIIEDMRSTVSQSATSALARGIALDGANPDLIQGLATRRNQLVGETLEALRKFVAQKPDASRDQINQFVENLIEAAVTKDPRFQAKPGSPDKPLVPVWGKPLVNGVVPPHPGGPSARPGAVDFSSIPGIEIRGGRPVDNYGGALGEAQKQLEQGRNLSADMEARAKASGLTRTAFLASQQGQEVLEQASIRANAVLDNPRATPIQIAAAKRQLAYIRENKRTVSPTGGPQGAPELSGALGAFAQELGRLEGGAKAWEASNFGGAGDNPEGRPGLTRMTINQILKLPDHHVGMYQFQLGKGRTLELLKNKLGLTGNEPLTPELQNRMFTELMFGGWKRPELTAYLNGGTDLAAAERAFINEWEAGNKMNLREWLPKIRAQRLRQQSTAPRVRLSRANVLSINLEEPGKDRFQPGVDIFFKDGQFPSLVEGRVKEVSFEAGYGNYVVIETTDPVTGEVYDVLKSHLDSVSVTEGSRVSVGTIIGKQGSTGRTSPGGIASIDFLARAPKGSGSQTPYRRWRQERERVLSQIR
jgi:hypothetical protein